MLVVIALANIALGPLMNTFPGEFLMFSGLYRFNLWYTVFAGLGIILAAIYTLNMIQKIFLAKQIRLPSRCGMLPGMKNWY